MHARVATRVALLIRFDPSRSMSVAVAVPVQRPAESPTRKRPAISQATPNSLRHQEGGRSQHGEQTTSEEDWSTPDPVRRAAECEEGRDHAEDVGTEDHRHHQLREAELLLVQRIERSWQRRRDHRDGKGICARNDRRAPAWTLDVGR